MDFLVFDLEADGLLDTAERIWCGVTKNNNNKIERYTQASITDLLRVCNNLPDTTILSGHNIIEYDLPLLEKIYGYRHRGKVLDTLVLSRLLQPERQGGHSLDVWGERLGRKKPHHQVWSEFSPEMLHRCSEDVEINYLLLNHLLKEANIDAKELACLPCIGT